MTLGAGARDGEPAGTEALSLHLLLAVGGGPSEGIRGRGVGTRREWACMLKCADPPRRDGELRVS